MIKIVNRYLMLNVVEVGLPCIKVMLVLSAVVSTVTINGELAQPKFEEAMLYIFSVSLYAYYFWMILAISWKKAICIC